MMEADNIQGQVFDSVWDALEDSPTEAANMRLRSELMIAYDNPLRNWARRRPQLRAGSK